MRILVVSRADDDRAVSYASGLAGELEELSHRVVLEEALAKRLGFHGTGLGEARADLVVVVGGDGSVLHTIQGLKEQVPVLGINWGEVGFLAELEPAEAPGFLANLREGFRVERRMRIAISLDRERLGDALNEAVIVTSRPAKMLRFTVEVDGILAERFRADGTLVSTPTGSTAYAMSAGGPIMDPRVDGFLLVPLAPYMLSSRPIVIGGDRVLRITLESEKPAKLVLDGQRTTELARGAVLTVHRSPDPALFVDVGKSFFDKVDQKLRRL
ncbi:MAG TPA: NAD(+)/NADH kinase [Methanomicrobiales archaeon]|nr:NAD(+)/NADH kinase [Methanomicrobiales archaeon]